MRGPTIFNGVALLAQPGRPRLQQLRVGRPMGLMAIQAVLHNRRMLPQERTPSLGMALVAVFVGGGLDELLGIGAAVRVVAVRASDLPLPKGHVRGAHQLRASHLVALKANLYLSGLDELPILRQGLSETK